MSIVLPWWRSRLEARCPFATLAYWVEGVTYRPNRRDSTDRWPNAVARFALYGDYFAWHGRYCKLALHEHHEAPEPVEQRPFFKTMAPWLYTIGRKAQTISYPFPRQLHYQGEWYPGKAIKHFIRLESWETHCAAFERATGAELNIQGPARQLIDDITRSKGYAGWNGTIRASN